MGLRKSLLGFLVLTLTAANVNADKRPVTRIIRGKDAEISDYPYQVAILLSGRNHCGGAIYHPRVIITAAHCLEGYVARRFKIRAGSSYRKNGGIVANISSLIIHPKYDNLTYLNDVGLVILEKPLQLGPTIRQIQLVTTTPRDGDKAVLTGFGQTSPDKPVYEDQLQYTEVEIISNKKCASKKYDHGSNILEGMICAGGGDSNTCYGDSGGPMVVDDKLAGVTSWGPETCGEARLPAIYTDIAKFIPWIKETKNKALT